MTGTDNLSVLLSRFKNPKMRVLINGWQIGEFPNLEEYFGIYNPDRHWDMQDLDEKNSKVAQIYREDILTLLNMRRDIPQVQRQWLIRLFFICAPSVFEDDLVALLCDPDFDNGFNYIDAGISQMNPDKVREALSIVRNKGINTPLCAEIAEYLPSRHKSVNRNDNESNEEESRVDEASVDTMIEIEDTKIPPAIKKLSEATTGEELIAAIDNLERRKRQYYILAFSINLILSKLTNTSLKLGPEARGRSMEYLFKHLNSNATTRYQKTLTEDNVVRKQTYSKFQTSYTKMMKKYNRMPAIDSDKESAFFGIFALVVNGKYFEKLIQLLLLDNIKFDAKGEECRSMFKTELGLD